MHAYIIIGGTKDIRMTEIQERLKKDHISPFDIIALNSPDGTIGIDRVREFQHNLMFIPYHSKQKMGVISDAETLTIEAQNALLKTLEEPPAHTILLLETANPDFLLLTILSRCQIIRLKGNPDVPTIDVWSAFAGPIGKRIQLVDEIAKTRDEAKQWVEKAIFSVRHAMLLEHSIRYAGVLRRLLAARSHLAANVNPKLVMDAVVLSEEHAPAD
ncbi:hypothetical protein HY948_00180 [Candidatus Gottesmanbacteria bacterium]|nr:hypothetical protein [Candidatus Gottesmanbacteria bacterium]